MRNKKLISLICALSMIFTMFSAFTVVNAEGEKGIALASNLSADGKTITIEATAVGITAADNFTVNIPIPEGVTKDQITVSPTYGNNILGDGTFSVNNVDMSGNGMQFTDGKIVTITITMANPLAEVYECKLVGKSAIKEFNADSYKISNGTLTAATTTVSKWVDPNRKPDTVARPEEEEVPPTEEIPEPVVPTDKGIALDGSVSKDGKTITIEATAVGITAADNFTVNIPIPEGVTKDQITVSPTYGNNILGDGTFSVNNVDMSGNGMQFTDGKIVTITITMANPLAEVYECKLVGKSAIKEFNADSYKISNGTLTAASTVIVPSEEKPAVKKTAALKDYTDKEAASAAKAAEDAGKTTYMTVDVKKDGAAATYGSDFIAKYDGKEIKTVEEYKNIIHGYVEDKKVSDVIAKMTFEFYTDGKFAISTTVNAEGEETQLVNPVTDKTVGGGNEPEPPKPSEPKFKANFNPSRPDVGDTVVVTAEISDATDVTITFDEAAFKADTDSANLVSYLGIYPKKDVDNSTEDDTKYLENTWEFKAMAAGELTVPFKVSYTKVSDGTKVTDEVQKATVKISEVDNNNGGNGGSGNGSNNNNNNTGGGAIAPPANNGGNGVFTSFTDLDQAEWAKQAIMVLSVKGIVSGYGDGTFNPNGNITRAEYCQILIGAIGKTNLAADVLFNDVPSEAWYYHAVSVANSLGIVSGYGDGNFGPNDLITRQDMALMTYKAAQVMNKDVSSVRTMSFADAGSIAEYAATAVQTLADAGIINGVSDTEFAPVANATRAQAAKILYDTFVKVN